jgi:hypothetical protein
MFRDVYARLDLDFTADIEQRCRTLDQRPTSIVKGKPAKAKWKQQNPELVERILDRIAPMQQRLGYDTGALARHASASSCRRTTAPGA